MNTERLLATAQSVGINFGIRILTAIAIYLIGKFVISILLKGLTKVLQKRKVDPTISSFVTNLTRIALMIFVFIAVLARLGIQTTSFIAILGAASFAVGLALQGALSNFAAGVLIMLFRPFKVGDLVDVAGKIGVVEEISILVTTFVTPDNRRILTPNSKVMSDTITNFTTLGKRRVDMVIGVGYGDDLDLVHRTIKDELSKNELILAEPATQIAVESLGDSSVNFAVRPWCKESDYWAVKFGVLEAVKKRFDKEGINIPFPQRDVHLIKE